MRWASTDCNQSSRLTHLCRSYIDALETLPRRTQNSSVLAAMMAPSSLGVLVLLLWPNLHPPAAACQARLMSFCASASSLQSCAGRCVWVPYGQCRGSTMRKAPWRLQPSNNLIRVACGHRGSSLFPARCFEEVPGLVQASDWTWWQHPAWQALVLKTVREMRARARASDAGLGRLESQHGPLQSSEIPVLQQRRP